MARVIPSQAANRYMQQLNAQQQQAMLQQGMSPAMSNSPMSFAAAQVTKGI